MCFSLGSMSQLVKPVACFRGLCSGCYESFPIFHYPSSPQTVQLCGSPQRSGWGYAEVGLLANDLQCWRSQVFILFPLAGVSWYWAVLSCRRNVIVKVKLFLSSSIHLFSEILLKWDTVSFHCTSRFSQNYSHPWKVVKISISVEMLKLESFIPSLCWCYFSRILNYLTCCSTLKFKNNKTPIKKIFHKAKI